MQDREVIQDSQHSFTNNKSCLTNLVAFYNGVTTPVDNDGQGRNSRSHLSDLCKAFDMEPHSMLLSKLERDEFDGGTVQWMSRLREVILPLCSHETQPGVLNPAVASSGPVGSSEKEGHEDDQRAGASLL